MANTYELIAKVTVTGAGTYQAQFNSIPSTYTDLLLRVSARNTFTGSTDALVINYNGSSSSQSSKALYGNGASAGSFNTTFIYGGELDTNSQTANTFSSHDIYIPNYAGSQYKSSSTDSVEETNGTTVYAILSAGLWSNTAAITSITCATSGASELAINSTFYLYGIKNS
jgi:hypothetical protein